MPEAKKRKPAALIAAEKKIAELEMKIKSSEESKNSWYRNYCDEQRKIEELHAIFDAIPNAPARKFTNKSGMEAEMSLSGRFVAWLANGKN